MNSIIKEKIVDLSNNSSYCFEIAPHGKGDYRYCDFVLTNNGKRYQIPSGAKAYLDSKECNVIDNKIRISLNGILEHDGVNKHTISLYYNNSLITSFEFTLHVTGSSRDIFI